jgi:hypothetical protein
MQRGSFAVRPLLALAGIVVVFACSGSSTSPKNLTTPYVGTYKMDSVTVAALATQFPPNGTLDSASGEAGTLQLKADSFYANFTGSLPQRDSGLFSISGAGQWTLSGTFFSGTGTGVLSGNQLILNLSGGQAVGSIYGLFTKNP